MSYRIVLAEDQHLIRDSLQVLLAGDKDLEIQAAASDGEEALRLCRSLKPDIALLDVRMPVMSGLEAAAKIKEENLPCKVVLLTTFDEEQILNDTLALGAEGFLLKDIRPDLFRTALKGIAEGLLIYHPSLMKSLQGNRRPRVSGRIEDLGLTERDMTVIRLIAEGLGNKEIASREGCSEGTVKNRVSSILTKMGLQARTQIAVYAIKNNLISDLD